MPGPIMLIIQTWIYLALVDNSSAMQVCNYTNTTSICTCSGFTSFDQIDISPCQHSDCKTLNLLTATGSSVVFNRKILPLLQYYEYLQYEFLNTVFLYNLAGIDLEILRNYDSLFRPIRMAIRGLTVLRFSHLNFNFYLDGQPLQLSFDKNAPPGKRCNESLFVEMFGTYDNIFNLNGFNIDFLDPHFTTSNLCPFIFQNYYSIHMNIYGRPFEFDTTEYSNLGSLSARFKTIIINWAYKLNIDNSTFHPYLYGPTMIEINFYQCSINKIQANVFERYTSLRKMSIILNNLRSFFHLNGIEWTTYLNSGIDPAEIENPTNSSFFVISINTNGVDDYLYQEKFFPYFEYNFPDEDYCLFQDFPHHKLVVANIFSKKPLNCSCTLFSLVQYYWIYYHNFHFMPGNYYDQIWNCYIRDFDWIGETNCNFSCNVTTVTTRPHVSTHYQAHYFDLYDLKNEVQVFKYWSLNIFGPVICLIGCVTNALVIFTIKSANRISKKRTKNAETSDQKHSLIDPKQPFFVYMLINSVINLINCIMFLIYYIVKCDVVMVGDKGLISPVCFYETLSVNVSASVLKLISNFTFLQMSVNRYALVGKDHYKFLLRVANMRIRRYVGWAILVSLTLSVIVYYQQKFFSSSIGTQVFSDSYYNNDYLWYGYEGIDVTLKARAAYNSTIEKIQELPFLSGFTMVHDLFSYFLFCIVTTVIDAMTVVRLKRVLEEKKQILAKATSQAKSAKKQKAQSDEIEKSEKKSIAMIVLNSLAIFILRFPELISVIFFYDLLLNQNSYYTYKMFCYSYRQCLAVLDLSNIFYLFSLSLNFIFYYLFNISFKTTLNETTDLLIRFYKRITNDWFIKPFKQCWSRCCSSSISEQRTEVDRF